MLMEVSGMQGSSNSIKRSEGRPINVHGLDAETKLVFGFLARYHGATQKCYEYDLKVFQEWTRNLGILSLLKVERLHIELYVRSMVEAGLKPATIRRRYGTVHGMYKMAHIDSVMATNPAAYVAVPKVQHDQQTRTYFESVDMAIVIRMATVPLDRAVITLMFDLALRVGELCSLDVSNIIDTPSGPVLRFIGKGNKLAVMAIPPTSIAALRYYLGDRSWGPLFINKWNNRLTRENVQTIINRLRKQAGIDYPVTTHGIRRTSCRFGLQQGESIESAADRLRHIDTKTTKMHYGIDTGIADINRMKVAAQMANLAR